MTRHQRRCDSIERQWFARWSPAIRFKCTSVPVVLASFGDSFQIHPPTWSMRENRRLLTPIRRPPTIVSKDAPAV